jgi:hypothetical protein
MAIAPARTQQLNASRQLGMRRILIDELHALGIAACSRCLCRGGKLMRVFLLVLLLLSTSMLGGCELIGNIFQAGMWVGMIVVLLVLVGIAFVAGKLRG